MLTVSRIDGKRLVVKMEKFNLNEVAEQIYEELKIGANNKKINFIYKPYKTTLKVKADKIRIAEVIQNIVGNALKFTPEKGFVTITLTKNEQKLAQLEVIDSGPGIPKKNLSKLFQKFGRLESSYQRAPGSLGTGLGLYIAKQIVDLHKGKIWAESKNGKGSRFVFTLPLKA